MEPGGGDRLALWLDRAEIADVITKQGLAVDARDWDRWRSLFTPDARLDYTAAWGIEGSLEEVVEWLSRLTDPAVNPQLAAQRDRNPVGGGGRPRHRERVLPHPGRHERPGEGNVLRGERRPVLGIAPPDPGRMADRDWTVQSNTLHGAELQAFEPPVASPP